MSGWLVIPIPPLNDMLDDIECSSWIALIERELEGNTLSEALKISTHDEEKLGIYFFTDYVEDIFWALFLLGLYEVLQKPEFISESILVVLNRPICLKYIRVNVFRMKIFKHVFPIYKRWLILIYQGN